MSTYVTRSMPLSRNHSHCPTLTFNMEVVTNQFHGFFPLSFADNPIIACQLGNPGQRSVPHTDRRRPRTLFPLPDGQRPVSQGEALEGRNRNWNERVDRWLRVLATKRLHRGPRRLQNLEVKDRSGWKRHFD